MLKWEVDLYDKCYKSAELLVERGYIQGNLSINKVADTLYKLEIEKIEKNKISDAKIDYNDEIVSIEDVGEKETIDISVSGDNLFFCNGILTKNSFGLPATADFMFALISTEDLEKLGQIMVKQLKSRYGNPNENKRFVIGINRSKMKLYDIEENAQTEIVDSGQKIPENNMKNKFRSLKVL